MSDEANCRRAVAIQVIQSPTGGIVLGIALSPVDAVQRRSTVLSSENQSKTLVNLHELARLLRNLPAPCESRVYRTSTRSKADPNPCAIAAYHGSWERPDNGFADRVLASAANGDAPISRCQKAQETTPAKSTLQRIPHHPTRRRRRLHP